MGVAPGKKLSRIFFDTIIGVIGQKTVKNSAKSTILGTLGVEKKEEFRRKIVKNIQKLYKRGTNVQNLPSKGNSVGGGGAAVPEAV